MNQIFPEKGIIDIIYQYVCGISLRQLDKLIRKHIIDKKCEEYDDKIYKRLGGYFMKILSINNINDDEERYVKIYLRHINRLICNKQSIGLRMLLKVPLGNINNVTNSFENHTDAGIIESISKIIQEVECKTKIKYKYIFYDSR